MIVKKTPKRPTPKHPSTKKQRSDPRTVRERIFETDSTYLLKLVIIVIAGAIWLRLSEPVVWLGVPLGAFPIGLLLGIVLVKFFETHQSDRKIWYAVLVIVGLISYVADTGIVI